LHETLIRAENRITSSLIYPTSRQILFGYQTIKSWVNSTCCTYWKVRKYIWGFEGKRALGRPKCRWDIKLKWILKIQNW